MNALGLAAPTSIRCQWRPVASPCRASLRPWGLDMDTKVCVRCGVVFDRPAWVHGRAWAVRQFCTIECYRSREASPLADRFWTHVRKTDGCWEWTGARLPTGYGVFGLDRETMVGAHRVSWELTNGPIPPGMFVCHTCDNPPCVRPDHLFLGTPRANVADMESKGRRVSRGASGSRNANAILAETDIPVIRAAHAAGEPYQEVARRYGVTRSLIGQIVRRKAWRHVP